jgi:effector-binding domain-containing protein
MKDNQHRLDRRVFLKTGIGGVAVAVIPGLIDPESLLARGKGSAGDTGIKDVIREEILFAGIRKPIKERAELKPRIEKLRRMCGKKIAGPLTHIFRFDTQVDGYDSEVGFPVSESIDAGEIKTHTLRRMHFFSLLHEGPAVTIRETTGKLYGYMERTGLSPDLELGEAYHRYDPEDMRVEVMASFLAWPEEYRKQLIRVLGSDAANKIWQGGESITAHTLVDERCAWVAKSIDRLKKSTTVEQQFDILSRVALIRPVEEIGKYKKIFDEAKDINAVFEAQHRKLESTRTGGFVDPPWFDGKILHVSKVPYNKEKYLEAKTPREVRRSYCFCALVREAKDPKIDPIFCYRAAGWARQFWEPILGVEFKRCKITHSILKGDRFCAWDYYLDS